MRTVLPIIVGFTLVSILTFAARSILRQANSKIWDIKALDLMARYLPFLAWLFFIGFGLAIRFELKYILLFAATGLSVILILGLILILTLPFSLLIRKLVVPKRFMKTQQESVAVDENRRKFLKTAAAVLPVLTIGATSNGFAAAFQKVKIPQIDLHFKNLAPALNGLKIFHLSDLHLGYYYQLDDLERLLTEVENQTFDLVLITGDIADDLNQLTDALKLIDQLKSAHPKFVSLGNHEYFRGLKEVRQRIDASPIPLLLNSHHVIRLKETNLVVAGADDPMIMRSDITRFLDNTVKLAVAEAPEQSFRILLSHRPRALDVAGSHKIDLVLAGHTNGGQMGLNNRSIFENIVTEPYLWGKYSKGASQLYTSSGVGHWFPFRLGCPAEAPVIVLKKV